MYRLESLSRGTHLFCAVIPGKHHGSEEPNLLKTRDQERPSHGSGSGQQQQRQPQQAGNKSGLAAGRESWIVPVAVTSLALLCGVGFLAKAYEADSQPLVVRLRVCFCVCSKLLQDQLAVQMQAALCLSTADGRTVYRSSCCFVRFSTHSVHLHILQQDSRQKVAHGAQNQCRCQRNMDDAC
jgi:hypothetical protein